MSPLAVVPLTSTSAQASGSVMGPVAGWTAWVSSPTDASRRLVAPATTTEPATTTLRVTPTVRGQRWLGVGAALTDASAGLLTASGPAASILFDPANASGAHLNLVRLPLSATDFSTSPWTYGWDDAARTLTAPQQANDQVAVLTQKILPLRPDTAVIGASWSAPATMKSSGSLNGGGLLDGSLPSYGRMLSAQVAWLQGQHVPVMAVTLGNEPYYEAAGSGGYPSMLLTDAQQVDLARAVGPEVAAHGVELWAVDHNWGDRAHYDTVEGAAPSLFQASAFHCYGGTPGQMAGVAKRPIVTECTGTTDGFPGTFRWDALNLVVSAVESGSVGLLMWNLALNGNHGPHTNGCDTCRGVVEVDPVSGAVTTGPEFFTLAHLARAADPGAVRVATDPVPGFPHVAFLEPDGTIGIFGYNDTATDQAVEVALDGLASSGRHMVPAGNLFTIRGVGSLTPGSVAVQPANPTVGVEVSATVAGWQPVPETWTYEWLADGQAIPGATSAAFTPTANQVGRVLSVRVTGSRVGYAQAAVTSAPTAAVVAGGGADPGPDPSVTASPEPSPTTEAGLRNVVPPAILGLATVGRTLYVSPGDWSPSAVSLTYQWARSGRPIAGATRSTYRLTAADLGQVMTAAVAAQDPATGQTIARTAGSPGRVSPGSLAVVSSGRLVGAATPGGLLALGGLRVAPAPSIRYSWLRDGRAVALPGGSRSSYRVAWRDIGHRISLRATLSSPGYVSRVVTYSTVIRRPA